MSQRAPIFLLNGINMWQNFMGVKTVRTGVNGFVTVSLKMAPVWFAFTMLDSRARLPRADPAA